MCQSLCTHTPSCPPNFSLSTLHINWAYAGWGAEPSKGISTVTTTKEVCAQVPNFKPNHKTKFKFIDYPKKVTKAPLTCPGQQGPTTLGLFLTKATSQSEKQSDFGSDSTRFKFSLSCQLLFWPSQICSLHKPPGLSDSPYPQHSLYQDPQKRDT